jgi:hypothetical protein
LKPTDLSLRHVRQVAALVQRLSPEEIRELLRLVPGLQSEALALYQSDDLIAWVHEQLAPYTAEARPMQAEDILLGDQSVADYFALPEAERERLWAELYATAIASAPEREVKPDATVSAR